MAVFIQGAFKIASAGILAMIGAAPPATTAFWTMATQEQDNLIPPMPVVVLPPPPPPLDPLSETIRQFKVDFAQRVGRRDNDRTFNQCFTRMSGKQPIAPDGRALALIRGGAVTGAARLQTVSAAQNKTPIVVLDSGHGHEIPGSPFGYETGAIRGDVIEAVAVDAISAKVKEGLIRDGIDVVSTREPVGSGLSMSPDYRFSDQRGTLQYRAELSYTLAQKFPERPVLFLSLHGNTAGPNASGGEVFFYNGAGENSESAKFARAIARAYSPPGGTQIKRDNFAVLRCQNDRTPAVLLELGFITNPGDRARFRDAIRDPDKAEEIAQMVVSGVRGYLDQRQPLRPAITVAMAAPMPTQ